MASDWSDWASLAPDLRVGRTDRTGREFEKMGVLLGVGWEVER
jgi:hypothetical protein